MTAQAFSNHDLDALVKRAEELGRNQDLSDRAAGVNREILAIDPNNIPAHNRLARYFLLSGKPDDAGALYERVLGIDPQNRFAQNGPLNVQDAVNRAMAAQPPQHREVTEKRRSSGPVTYPDGEDDDAVREYFEALYPDVGSRTAALGMAAETIREVDQSNSASLGLTVRRTWSRLNVGAIGWGFFSRDGITLLAQKSAIQQLSPDGIRSVITSPADYQHVKDLGLGEVVHVYVPLSVATSVYPDLVPSHLNMVRDLARQVRRTPYYQSHTLAAIRYIQEVLGGDVPHPLH